MRERYVPQPIATSKIWELLLLPPVLPSSDAGYNDGGSLNPSCVITTAHSALEPHSLSMP